MSREQQLLDQYIEAKVTAANEVDTQVRSHIDQALQHLYQQQIPFVIMSPVPQHQWSNHNGYHNPIKAEEEYRQRNKIPNPTPFSVVVNQGNIHWESLVTKAQSQIDATTHSYSSTTSTQSISSASRGNACGAYTLLNIIKNNPKFLQLETVQHALNQSSITTSDNINNLEETKVRNFVYYAIQNRKEILQANGINPEIIKEISDHVRTHDYQLLSDDIMLAFTALEIQIFDITHFHDMDRVKSDMEEDTRKNIATSPGTLKDLQDFLCTKMDYKEAMDMATHIQKHVKDPHHTSTTTSPSFISNHQKAQNGSHGPNTNHQDALQKIQVGKKTGHWIWYVFPQIKGLGLRENDTKYSLTTDQAKLYLKDNFLRKNYIHSLKILYQSIQNHNSIDTIFDDIDAKKVKSSLTLFDHISNTLLQDPSSSPIIQTDCTAIRQLIENIHTQEQFQWCPLTFELLLPPAPKHLKTPDTTPKGALRDPKKTHNPDRHVHFTDPPSPKPSTIQTQRYRQHVDTASKDEVLLKYANMVNNHNFTLHDVERLTQHQAINGNIKTKEGGPITPLLIAIDNHCPIPHAKALITAGANLHDTYNGNTALHFAVNNHDYDMVNLLLSKAPDLVNKKNTQGNTPLHYATYNNGLNSKIAKTLIASGSNPHIANHDGITPASYATQNRIKTSPPHQKTDNHTIAQIFTGSGVLIGIGLAITGLFTVTALAITGTILAGISGIALLATSLNKPTPTKLETPSLMMQSPEIETPHRTHTKTNSPPLPSR